MLEEGGCPLCTAEPCFALMELDRDNNLSRIDLDMLKPANGFRLLLGKKLKDSTGTTEKHCAILWLKEKFPRGAGKPLTLNSAIKIVAENYMYVCMCIVENKKIFRKREFFK